MTNFTADEMRRIFDEAFEGDTAEVIAQVNNWLARGDGIAVYENVELGHPQGGHRQYVSFGSPAAQIETTDAPAQLPDIGSAINWRYRLKGTYRGEQL